MTEQRRPSIRALTATIAVAAVAFAAVIAGGLWLQMAAGRDPALGSGAPVAAAGSASSPKRIVRTTIIRRVVPGADGVPATTTAASTAPAPVQTATS